MVTTTQTQVVEPQMDAFRLLRAISRIGYTPHSALCDLIDNAVSAHATEIHVVLETHEGVSPSRRNSAKRYLVIDNGVGMDKKGLKNAMRLGSTDVHYEANSLAKFGLGLKSASLSQGDMVSLLSATSQSDPMKITLDMQPIETSGRYQCTVSRPEAEDLTLWDRHLSTSPSGTIVKVERIHRKNHPSVKGTERELLRRVGLIYYYFLADGDLRITLNGTRVIPFDPLFVNEANQNGDLDESDWDGTDVKWIRRPAMITINTDPTVQATIEATQLPHPRVYGQQRQQVREKYMIGAGNYGVYVYRNRRLISWAERFDNIVPLQQQLYAYRGRLLVDSNADDALNIDVTKSRIHLGDDAHKNLDDEIYEHRRLSRVAWSESYQKWKQAQGIDAKFSANEALATVELPDILPSEPDGIEAKKRREARQSLEERIAGTTADEAKQVEENQMRIILVDHLNDAVAWQRAYDPTSGLTIARLSQSHRFIRDIYGFFLDNSAATLTLHSMFYSLANGESRVIRNSEIGNDLLEEVFLDFRRMTSEFLYQLTAKSLAGELERDDKYTL